MSLRAIYFQAVIYGDPVDKLFIQIQVFYLMFVQMKVMNFKVDMLRRKQT